MTELGIRQILCVFCVSCVSCVFFASCVSATARPSTRLTVADLDAVAAAMAQSLLASDALAGRGPDSPPWVVSIQKVTNLSSDVILPREQWAVMAQLQGSLPLQALWKSRNIRFVLPAARVAAMRNDPDAPAIDASFGADRRPTHVMTAVFRSLTRAQAHQRTDVYYLQFELIDLAAGVPVWSDRFEFKRAASGSIRD